eukprot:TRINITY_DN37670_c0_g1_i2.p1 TRINITY_DN37670_c0_g1~~TRINITY_DN37670_c0_g1_i2.p1  ORF type:complete len:346 (-),score=48.48 TRINITY_DN37670_c0_g1_i2:578-1561(-)
MTWRCRWLLLSNVLLTPAADDACWSKGYSAAVCCDARMGLQGNSECWDGVFTYERCCEGKPQAPAKKRVRVVTVYKEVPMTADQYCWGLDSVKEHVCCDTRQGPSGVASCWGGAATFEACCTPFLNDRCSSAFSLKAGAGAAFIAVLLFVAIPAALPGLRERTSSPWKEPQGSEERLHVLDNAKFFMVCLVIAEHARDQGQLKDFMVGFTDDQRTDILKILGRIFLLHPTTFCLCSAFVWQRPLSARALRQLVFGLLLPFVFWCCLLKPVMLRLVGFKAIPEDAASLLKIVMEEVLPYLSGRSHEEAYVPHSHSHHGVGSWQLRAIW